MRPYFKNLQLINEKCDLVGTKILKYNLWPSDKSFFLKWPRKDKEFEKWNVESISDSPFSLFLPPQKAKTFLSWQIDKCLSWIQWLLWKPGLWFFWDTLLIIVRQSMKEWSLILSALQSESLCISKPKKLGKLRFFPKRLAAFKIWQIKLLMLMTNL